MIAAIGKGYPGLSAAQAAIIAGKLSKKNSSLAYGGRAPDDVRQWAHRK